MDCLKACGFDAVVLTAELIVGELVANAVRHGHGVIDVVLLASADRVRIEVRDRGGGRPAIRPTRHTGPDAGGWGLRMVDQLAAAWGTNIERGRTLVWAELTSFGVPWRECPA